MATHEEVQKAADKIKPQEDEILEQIEVAKKANDFGAIKKLMKKLISIQEKLPVLDSATDEEIASWGVDLIKVDKERKLQEEINQANQDGDFIKSQELTRELIKLQRTHPVKVGVKMYE